MVSLLTSCVVDSSNSRGNVIIRILTPIALSTLHYLQPEHHLRQGGCESLYHTAALHQIHDYCSVAIEQDTHRVKPSSRWTDVEMIFNRQVVLGHERFGLWWEARDKSLARCVFHLGQQRQRDSVVTFVRVISLLAKKSRNNENRSVQNSIVSILPNRRCCLGEEEDHPSNLKKKSPNPLLSSSSVVTTELLW